MGDTVSAVKRQVIRTDQNGAKLTPEQLADAGVQPGERAIVEIRRYTPAEWITEGEGRVFESDEEEDEFFDRAPEPRE